jgi:hypothetical protein
VKLSVNFYSVMEIINSMWLLTILLLLNNQVNSQKIASSVLKIAGSGNQYDTKSTYFDNYTLVSSVTGFEIASSSFQFSYQTTVIDIDNPTQSCTLRTNVSLSYPGYTSVTVRFILVSLSLDLRAMDVNTSGSVTVATFDNQVTWIGTTVIVGLIKGWLNLSDVVCTYLISGSTVTISSNITTGWVIYQIIVFNAG